MTADFKGKAIVSTGSAQGLREAVLRLVAERGACGAVVSGRSRERGERVAENLAAAGCRAVFVPVQLEDATSRHGLIAAAGAERGTLEDTSRSTGTGSWQSIYGIRSYYMQETVKIMQCEGRGGNIAFP